MRFGLTVLGKRLKHLLISVLFVLFMAGAAFAGPSVVESEGNSVVWSVGDMRVWRFPDTYASDVLAMSDRFNSMYERGFKLVDLKVEKRDNKWSLCVGKNVLFAAEPEHGGIIRLNTHMMSLMWMSKIYEAVGSLHAKALTPEYRLRGGYDITASVSWYGDDKFFGRRFANGERFTESHLTAAAMNLPFGTLVRVSTPGTGKSVVVRITDRFKEHRNRALDLSRAAAEVLGIKRMGIAKVQLQVIGRVETIGGK